MERNLFTYKKITNLIANKISQYFDEIQPKNVSQLWVTYVGRFYVITGESNVTSPINIGQLVNDYLSEFYGDDWEPINVLDLIEYGKHWDANRTISFGFDKYDGMFTEPKVLMTENSKHNKPITSDEIFGSSLFYKKMYFAHFSKIANHLFKSSFCNDVRIKLVFDNVDEPSLMMFSDSWLVSSQHAFNVVDATFSHKESDIIEKMNLHNFDFENLILEKGDYPWSVRDRIKDFTMI